VTTSPSELERALANRTVGTRLLYENEAVRVWEIALEPGKRLPFHRHATSYFYRCHSGGRVRVRTPEGDELEYESPADEVHFHRIGPEDVVVHDLENVGDTLVTYTTVELLGGA
jgi:quercetin dioxygenase-like cupin family protein